MIRSYVFKELKNIELYQNANKSWESAQMQLWFFSNENDIKSSNAALNIAVEKNDIEIVKLLLSHPKIDVNILSKSESISKTALHEAVFNGNVEIVKLLLSHPKIDVNIQKTKIDVFCSGRTETKTALHIAYQRKKQEIIDILLQRNDIDADALDYDDKKPSDYENDNRYHYWWI